MSETKVAQFPLPLPREVGGHVWLIELPGQPITIADKTMAFDLVNRYNAGQKVEELVRILLYESDWYKGNLIGKAREVESALGGKAE